MEQFSRSVGIAYQIKDDLKDFKSADGHYEIHKPSVLLSMLTGKLLPDDKKLFEDAYQKNDIGAIQQMVESFNINQGAEDLLKNYIKETNNSLDSFQNTGLKMALHEILGNIFKRVYLGLQQADHLPG